MQTVIVYLSTLHVHIKFSLEHEATFDRIAHLCPIIAERRPHRSIASIKSESPREMHPIGQIPKSPFQVSIDHGRFLLM